jgi:hypothetical protein
MFEEVCVSRSPGLRIPVLGAVLGVYPAKTVAVLKQVHDRRKAMNEKNARTALDHTLLTTFRRHETTMDVTMLKKRTTTRTRSMGRVPACCSRNARRGGHPRMLWVIL